MAQDQQQQSQFEEPKILFTIKLIEDQQHIAFLLNNGLNGRAAKEIATMLIRLDIKPEEKEMLELYKSLTPANYFTFSDEKVFEAYGTLCVFLNKTYFADYYRAKPKRGIGRL